MFICKIYKFNPKIRVKKKEIKNDTIYVVGYSRKNWIRYAHHLLEGIVKIFGYEVQKVRCIYKNKKKDEIYQIVYNNGLNVNLHFSENMRLPINFVCMKKSTFLFMCLMRIIFSRLKK